MSGRMTPHVKTSARLAIATALAGLVVTAGVLTTPTAAADDSPTLTIKNNRFEPTEIRVPAGKRVTVYIVNDDASPEEFESYSLKVEKIIPGKTKGLVRIGPLEKGRYEFFGDFHQDTAKGTVIAE
jgi:plastocyanin